MPNGSLQIVKPLDHEKSNKHTLLIIASDQPGKGEAKEVNATVIINVCNRNDNDPEFGKATYSFSVIDDAMPGDAVGKLIG